MPLIPKALFPFLILALAACQPDSELRSAPTINIDLSYELIDESANVVSLDDFDAQLRLVFFGFTTCPDICPITLQNVAMALNSMASQKTDVTVLFISIDPNRDTPERLAQYTDAFHPAVVGLTASYEQITAVTTEFRTTFGHTMTDADGQERPLSQEEYEALPPTAAYNPFHSSQLYVLGSDGELLDIIGYGSTPTQIEATLRKYL
jgi:protein SCO1/2